MSVVMGVDPGLKGGVAFLSPSLAQAWPMPLAGKEINVRLLRRWVLAHQPKLAVVEKVASRPGQGVVSMFKFGMGYGTILGALGALEVPVMLVTPQKWKSRVLVGVGKDKAATVEYVARRWPSLDLVLPRCRKPHDGMADALCLAEYGRGV